MTNEIVYKSWCSVDIQICQINCVVVDDVVRTGTTYIIRVHQKQIDKPQRTFITLSLSCNLFIKVHASNGPVSVHFGPISDHKQQKAKTRNLTTTSSQPLHLSYIVPTGVS